MKTIRLSLLATALLPLVLMTPAHAQQVITGQIQATYTLTSTCQINGDGGSQNVNFGTIDHGTNHTLFEEAHGQMLGGVGNGFSIQCTPGSDVSFTLLSGVHDDNTAGGHNHAMKHGSGEHYIPYSLYTDSAHSEVLLPNTPITITADGTVQTIELYSRAIGADGLAAGTYTDTLSVQVEF